MSWKKITVPKMVYLPTGSPDAVFKDTGLRVEPSDDIEILSGSRSIRVNGKEHHLLIPADSLRLDANNCLILDAPAPPVASLSPGGNGRAFVGGLGSARARAGGDNFWTQDLPPIHSRTASGPVMEMDDDLYADKEDPTPEFDPTVFNEERITRTVTLKDGTTAEVLIDPSTGRIVSNPFRTYDGIGCDPKEAARLLAEQNRSAQEVPTYRTAKPVHAPQALAQPRPIPKSLPIPRKVAFGIQDLDGLLEGGLNLGSITHLCGNKDVLDTLTAKGTVAPSIEVAFARIHLMQPTEPRPIVFIRLDEQEDPSDQLRLTLAEQLPILANMVREHGKVAVCILTPPWEARTPALLNYIPTTRVTARVHDTDRRFITVTVTVSGNPQGTNSPKTASFPNPKPA